MSAQNKAQAMTTELLALFQEAVNCTRTGHGNLEVHLEVHGKMSLILAA